MGRFLCDKKSSHSLGCSQGLAAAGGNSGGSDSSSDNSRHSSGSRSENFEDSDADSQPSAGEAAAAPVGGDQPGGAAGQAEPHEPHEAAENQPEDQGAGDPDDVPERNVEYELEDHDEVTDDEEHSDSDGSESDSDCGGSDDAGSDSDSDHDTASCNGDDDVQKQGSAAHFKARRHVPLFPKDQAACSLTVEQTVFVLMEWRRRHKIRTVAFEELLQLLNKVMLPADNHLPPSLYIIRKFMG